ncbi:MAG: C40 family peptidase [Christensenellales bacterium]
MKRKQLNNNTSRFVRDEVNPEQPAFSIPSNATSGQHGPKSGRLRQDSETPRLSERLRHEDETPPGGEAADSGAAPRDGPSDKKAAKDGKRMEKSGEKLNTAREKLANQKSPKKPGPIKTVGRAAKHQTWRYVHGKIHQVERENAGIEAAHKTELAGEHLIRGGTRFIKKRIRTRPARQVRKWERKAISAKADYAYRQLVQENPRLKSNPLSRLWQKRQLKKQYRKQAKEAAKTGAKAAKKTAVTVKNIAGTTWGVVRSNPKVVLILACAFLLIVVLQSCMGALTTIGNGLVGAVGAATYPSEDSDMLAAETIYSGMEADLQNYMNHYESTHDYDEYHYDLDEIWHDPYALISILSALHEGAWTLDEVQDNLAMLFERQYILTETVEVEVRYRTETDTWTETDPETGETTTHTDTYQVPYNYYVCTVALENFNLSHLPIYIMSEAQVSRYALYTATLGNRPDLFGGTVKTYMDYDIPEEYLSDETFAAIIEEAEKYLGYPYVWGGYCPATSFDCSGFVSWVNNHSGWGVGRLGAQGLCNICTPVSAPQVRPGDLVFFTGTYDTPGVSHVAIYVGDGMMLHAGNPIGYADLTTNYWQNHFYGFGRLP